MTAFEQATADGLDPCRECGALRCHCNQEDPS